LSSIPDADRPTRERPRRETALDSYARAVKAHKLLVAIVVLATLLASLAWIVLRGTEYKATSALVINPLSQTDDTFLGLPVVRDSGDPTRTVQTAAALLDSPAAADRAARRLGAGWTAQRVIDHVDVQPSGETDIVDVTARAAKGGDAVRIANTFATASLASRDAALRHALSQVIHRLRRIRAHTQSRDPSAPLLDSRIAQLEELRIGGDPTVDLSRLASRSSRVGASTLLIVLLALLAGGVLASGAALLTERLGPETIRDEQELTDIDPLPVLAHIPAANAGSFGARWSARVTPDATSGLRSLRLLLKVQRSKRRAILVTSPSTGDGKTTCLVDLAVELGAAGERVILVDLDLRRPELAQRLGIDGDVSLATVASGAPLTDALLPVPGFPTVQVVAGTRSLDESMVDHLGSRFSALVAEALQHSAYVLIDTSALGEDGDALRFAGPVTDILLVARLNHSSMSGVRTVRDLLRQAGKPPMGYILVGRDRQASQN
jgi:tyrosine-protein kinase